VHVALVGSHGVKAQGGQSRGPALLGDQAHAQHADSQPTPLLGQVGGVQAPLASPVAQTLDHRPAGEHVGGVGDLLLGGEHVLGDVAPNPGQEVLELDGDGEVDDAGGGGAGARDAEEGKEAEEAVISPKLGQTRPPRAQPWVRYGVLVGSPAVAALPRDRRRASPQIVSEAL